MPTAVVDIEPEDLRGPPGTRWFSGAGPPATVPGELPDDFYLDESSGDVYGLVGAVWTWCANICGPDGPPGAASIVPGPPGPVSTVPGPPGGPGAQGPPGPTTYALAAIAANVVRTGTTEGVVLTAQVPGGLPVGSTFRVRAAGVIGPVGNPTVRIRVGATGTIADTQAWIPAPIPNGVLNTVVHGEWLVTVKSATQVAVEGRMVNSVTNVTRATGAPALFTVATASPWSITLTSLMSTAGGALTWTHGFIDRRF